MLSPTTRKRKLLDSLGSVTADPGLSHGEKVRRLADKLAGASGTDLYGPDKEVEDLLKQAPPRVMVKRGDSRIHESNSCLSNRTNYPELTRQIEQDVQISRIMNRLDIVDGTSTHDVHHGVPKGFNQDQRKEQGNYATRCKPGNPLRCELGDLSGKQGKYAVGGGQRVYTDVDIPLYGELTVVGRSIVIHEANGGGGRLGCGTIRPMTQTATIAFPPIDNFDSTDFRTTVANLLEIAVWKVAIFYVPKTNTIRECQEVTFYVLGNIERSKVEALVSGSQASELGKYAPGDSCKSYAFLKLHCLDCMEYLQNGVTTGCGEC
uniref:Superoxide dismutase copper/zinc binding domain-containing protein n=1 Tax=Branchiostoma floridae TaxID=7739 RepID=C3YJ06_BRAFL|eukprot:XP_002603657.1 hypothetical protein BRAFLDRAFT_98599 [Branchiostoma floridae]